MGTNQESDDPGVVLLVDMPRDGEVISHRVRVSKQDVPAVLKLTLWIDSKGYVRCTKSTGYLYLHNYIMQFSNPLYPIDHINENPLDNRRSNLRVLARIENMQRPVTLDEEEARLLQDYQDGKLSGNIHELLRERRDRRQL